MECTALERKPLFVQTKKIVRKSDKTVHQYALPFHSEDTLLNSESSSSSMISPLKIIVKRSSVMMENKSLGLHSDKFNKQYQGKVKNTSKGPIKRVGTLKV